MSLFSYIDFCALHALCGHHIYRPWFGSCTIFWTAWEPYSWTGGGPALSMFELGGCYVQRWRCFHPLIICIFHSLLISWCSLVPLCMFVFLSLWWWKDVRTTRLRNKNHHVCRYPDGSGLISRWWGTLCPYHRLVPLVHITYNSPQRTWWWAWCVTRSLGC